MARQMKTPLALSTLTLLLTGCGATNSPCDVTDAQVDAYVIADLGITRLVPMTRAPKAQVAELCKVHTNPIGCTVWNKALVLDTLSGYQRVEVRAHEWSHVHQFQRWSANWTGASTLNEPDAYAYGAKVANKLCK